MPAVIIVRPRFDFATGYTFLWMRQVIDHAQRKGFAIIDLSGANATQENLFSAVQDPDVVAVFIATHGASDLVVGDLDSPLLKSCENDDRMVGKIVIYGSCLSGQFLAKTTQKKGAPVAIGYLTEFIWHIDPKALSPGEDKIAEPFKAVFIEPFLAILDGLAPAEVYKRTMARYEEAYAVVARGTTPETAMMLVALDNDQRGVIVYGEEGIITAPARVWPILLLAGAALAGYLWWKKS